MIANVISTIVKKNRFIGVYVFGIYVDDAVLPYA